MEEGRRRAYLHAMQIDTWLPRVALPLAAASRLEVVEPMVTHCQDMASSAAKVPLPSIAVVSSPTDAVGAQHARLVLAVDQAASPTVGVETAPSVDVVALEVKASELPRFSLQLLRSGNCLLLVDAPEQAAPACTSLLRDLLRAARLPIVTEPFGDGEPLNWPILHSSSIWSQDMAAAQDYVQEVILVATEQQEACCLWLFGGLPRRLMQLSDANDGGEPYWAQLDAVNLPALCLPSLNTLMNSPSSKPKVWQEILVRQSCWAPEEVSI